MEKMITSISFSIPVITLLDSWRVRYKRYRYALNGSISRHSLDNFGKLEDEIVKLIHKFGMGVPLTKKEVFDDVTNLFVYIETVFTDAASELADFSNLYCDIKDVLIELKTEQKFYLSAIENGFYSFS